MAETVSFLLKSAIHLFDIYRIIARQHDFPVYCRLPVHLTEFSPEENGVEIMSGNNPCHILLGDSRDHECPHYILSFLYC